MQRSILSLLFAALSWGAAAQADAQAGGSRLHIGAAFALDVGGEAEINDVDYDLDATPGLRGHLDYAVHRYVSVGGLTRLSWWEPDNIRNVDRSLLFDLGPRVIGHYDYKNFRFYAGLSPGLTISAIDDNFGLDDVTAGFTLSVTVGGFEWWFSRGVGLFTEIGWVGHWFEHERDNTFANDAEIDLSQAMLAFGVVFGP